MPNHGAEFARALMAKYAAEILECKATIRIYFEHPVGIGEHPQHLEEIDKLIGKMSDATDKLEALQNAFPEYSD